MASPIDLTDLTMNQVRERLGELVEISLRKSRVAVLVAREDGVLTLLDPRSVGESPDEVLVECLVDAEWTEGQIEEFLTHLKEKACRKDR